MLLIQTPTTASCDMGNGVSQRSCSIVVEYPRRLIQRADYHFSKDNLSKRRGPVHGNAPTDDKHRTPTAPSTPRANRMGWRIGIKPTLICKDKNQCGSAAQPSDRPTQRCSTIDAEGGKSARSKSNSPDRAAWKLRNQSAVGGKQNAELSRISHLPTLGLHGPLVMCRPDRCNRACGRRLARRRPQKGVQGTQVANAAFRTPERARAAPPLAPSRHRLP